MTSPHRLPRTHSLASVFILLGVLLFCNTATAQVIPVQREAKLRQLLPAVEADEQAEFLAADDLFFWDDRYMPRTYQAFGGFHDIWYRHNRIDPVTHGNREFPWDATAGTQDCPDVWSFKLLRLPKDSHGNALPIVWYFSSATRARFASPRRERVIRWRARSGHLRKASGILRF